ncbi:uncharacterized protein LOC143683361 [Tamandua tetradactyla]|uniref:uncharacterized protein LOC143683361 n=1 Tax=Tamandua tetradactyla TaxID=48850 RepID=UPI0040538F54
MLKSADFKEPKVYSNGERICEKSSRVMTRLVVEKMGLILSQTTLGGRKINPNAAKFRGFYQSQLSSDFSEIFGIHRAECSVSPKYPVDRYVMSDSTGAVCLSRVMCGQEGYAELPSIDLNLELFLATLGA